MELGLTFPLQHFLHIKSPPYGTAPPDGFCWDLHVITLRGRASLLAVHSVSRYAFVLYDLGPAGWAALEDTFCAGLRASAAAAGMAAVVESRLAQGGAAVFTRTHGRRPVAFLNRAWADVMALDHCLAESTHTQPLLDAALNALPSRCAGFAGLGPASARFVSALQEA